MKKANKKIANNKKQKLINLALAVFGLSIVVFTVLGAYIIDNFSNIQQIEDLSHMEEDSYKGQIDDKLRFIAMQEDNMPKEENLEETDNNNTEAEENKEIDNIPETITLEPEDIADFLMNREDNIAKTKFEEYNEKYRKKSPDEENYNDSNTESASEEETPYKKISQTTNLNLKVVIGDFSTKAAAEQELLSISSQFSTPPFLKVVNNAYVIQVAAFKTPETAYEYVNSLRQQGYTARIIEE